MRKPKTPKHHNTYTARITTEILRAIYEISPMEHMTDSEYIRIQEAVQAILIRETHDMEETA